MKLKPSVSPLTRILMPVVGCFSLMLATLNLGEAQNTTSPPGVGIVSIPGSSVGSPVTVPGASNPTGTSNSALTGIPSSSSVDNGTAGFGSMGTDLSTHSQGSLLGPLPPPATSGCVGAGCGTLPLTVPSPAAPTQQQAGETGGFTSQQPDNFSSGTGVEGTGATNNTTGSSTTGTFDR